MTDGAPVTITADLLAARSLLGIDILGIVISKAGAQILTVS